MTVGLPGIGDAVECIDRHGALVGKQRDRGVDGLRLAALQQDDRCLRGIRGTGKDALGQLTRVTCRKGDFRLCPFPRSWLT